MIEFFSSIYTMFNEAALYLLVGFGAAGVLRYLLSEKVFLSWFGKDNFGSVMLASILGVPLPLCSCSVLPVGVAMRKRGASRGAVTSFLISTPETGVDSIMITYALLDPIMTVARPVVALFTALFTGSVVNWFGRRGLLGDAVEGTELASGNGETSGDGDAPGKAPGDAPVDGAGNDCCCSAPVPNGEGGFLIRAIRYGYFTLLDDLVSVLVFAFICSGVIAVAVPESLFDTPLAQGFPAMLIMLFVGIPFYVCATASTPIAATLLLKGLSPGAALVFLMAGPATNLGSLFALNRYLGRKTVAVYLVCISVVTLFCGMLVDTIYRDYDVDVSKAVGQVSEMISPSVKAASAVVLLILLVRSAWKTRMLRKWGENLRKLCLPLHFDPLSRGAIMTASLLIVLGYASTAFSIVGVGEVGWVLRFGRVTPGLEEPGLSVHLPWPVETVKVCRPGEVHTLECGFERGAEASDPVQVFFRNGPEWNDTELDAEVMNGEENIVSIRFSVHYRVSDPYLYTFQNSDPAEAVRALAFSSVRIVCSPLLTDRILVGHRNELEKRVRSLLQEEVDAAGIGVEIVWVTWVDVHAPPNVHYAFRDVASAAEEKEEIRLLAESDRFSTVAAARGRAERIRKEAEIYFDEKISTAKGRAAAFLALSEACRKAPDVTRTRLYIEVMERVLARARTVIPLAEGIDVELWMKDGAAAPPFIGSDGKGEEEDAGNAGDAGALDRKRAENPFRNFKWDK
jgi:HflK protein